MSSLALLIRRAIRSWSATPRIARLTKKLLLGILAALGRRSILLQVVVEAVALDLARVEAQTILFHNAPR